MTMEANLTELQKLRMTIVENLNYDIEKAKQVYNFVTGDEPIPSPSQQQSMPDGVYYVVDGGRLVSTDSLKSSLDKVIGVAVKMGDKIATVALHDAADGKEIQLTEDVESGTPEFYRKDFFDAITDWNGEANTNDYGKALNHEIGLQEGQYIPSLAQLHLILMNINEVNKALEAVGGTPMRKEWYWSSTEYSAYNSWYVYFSNGGSSYGCKYITLFVRPAVAVSA